MRLPVRFALIFVLVTVIQMGFAFWTVRALTSYATAQLSDNDEVIAEVERSLSVYSELAQAMKAGLRAKADAIAAQEPLRAAAILRDGPSIDQELTNVFQMYPDLVSVTILSPERDPASEPPDAPDQVVDENTTLSIGYRDRGYPIDDHLERKFEVFRPLDKRDGAPSMKVVFAAPRATLDNIGRASEFLQTYRAVRRDKRLVERLYQKAFMAMLVCFLVPGVGLGLLLARQVTRRIEALARATQAVGAGDLSVRVPVQGADELTDLALAFNRMLGELTESRARLEFLSRMGTWQEMARRLAHEIKNPLTPIQLAVQECHRRYDGDSKAYRKLLDTTREIVEEEVGTLRRLVTEFSNFARLPRSELAEGDLGAYLRDQRARLDVTESDDEETGQLQGVTVDWTVPDAPLNVAFDSFLLHRVLVNLTANAAQAIRGAGAESGRVQVSVREERGAVVIDIDDDGPGIPPELRERIFDPYFTTKSDGNGLGLAIVKKIIVEHGGTIEAFESPAAGARLRIRLPLVGTAASQVALSHSGRQSPPTASESAP